MKVRDLISQLEKLDKDRNIYILYDMFALLEPIVEVADVDEVDDLSELKMGDYLIKAN